MIFEQKNGTYSVKFVNHKFYKIFIKGHKRESNESESNLSINDNPQSCIWSNIFDKPKP